MGGWSWDDAPNDERARQEAENAVRQARRLRDLIATAIADPDAFHVTTEMICELARLAVEGIEKAPGQLRQRDDGEILGSIHDLPPWRDVPRLLDELCLYLNSGPNRDPIHLAAYALWRLNWIHPFEDGNGRTARALAYLVLCAATKSDLPGETTVIERLLNERRRYHEGLDAADRAARKGSVDVSQFETLLSELLRAQLDGNTPS